MKNHKNQQVAIINHVEKCCQLNRQEISRCARNDNIFSSNDIIDDET